MRPVRQCEILPPVPVESNADKTRTGFAVYTLRSASLKRRLYVLLGQFSEQPVSRPLARGIGGPNDSMSDLASYHHSRHHGRTLAVEDRVARLFFLRG